MSQITLEVPEELAARLQALEAYLPRILELGIRGLNAEQQGGFEGAAEVLEFLAALPLPEAILALRPSEQFQARVTDLLEKNRQQGLTAAEQQEWEQYQYLEHLVRMAKARAYQRLNE